MLLNGYFISYSIASLLVYIQVHVTFTIVNNIVISISVILLQFALFLQGGFPEVGFLDQRRNKETTVFGNTDDDNDDDHGWHLLNRYNMLGSI